MTKKPYSAISIANYFVKKGIDTGAMVTPMKLQKLVYFAHGWFLSLSGGQPLIKEKIGAWPFGPVIGTVYKYYSAYAKKPIDRLVETDEEAIQDAQDIAVLDKIWDVYGQRTAIELSNLTHLEGNAWDKTYRMGHSHTIPNELIKEDFDRMSE
ncbi:MAG TPA: hypothetical protein DCM27_07820 [Rhodospirillaceae bacterium]|nr:hypothetical protein [Rhodospirillaceae bacterium]